jgi:hypothetical protein
MLAMTTETYRLPPGPKTPSIVNGIAFLAARNALIRRLQRRYGDALTMQMPGFGQMVLVTRPDLVKAVYTAKPDVLHAGKNPLGEVLGPGSLFSMDEAEHLHERRMLLPPFHGELGAQHHREDVDPLVEAGVGEVVVDDLVDQPAVVGVHPPPAVAGAAASPVATQERHRDEALADRRHRRQQPLKFNKLLPFGAEDGAQDDPQRDPLEGLDRGELGALRPGRHLTQRLLLDDLLVGAHPLAVERRQQHAALVQMLGFVHREQRAGAEHFAERVLAGVQDVRLRRVDRFHLVGTGDQDHLAEARHLDRQRVAVAVLQASDERVASGQEGDAVEDARGLRARREAIRLGRHDRHGTGEYHPVKRAA